MSGQSIDMDPEEFAARLQRFEEARARLHDLMKSWDDEEPTVSSTAEGKEGATE